MGEENTSGGTARYVDSSPRAHRGAGERPQRQPLRGHLQRRCRRCSQHRHRGRVRAAGVRFKAWNPPSSPSDHRRARAAGVRHRRQLDQRSLAGCQYHVAHPGVATTMASRSTPTRPSRRLARFFQMGHTPGRLQVDRPPEPRVPVHARPEALNEGLETAPEQAYWSGFHLPCPLKLTDLTPPEPIPTTPARRRALASRSRPASHDGLRAASPATTGRPA